MRSGRLFVAASMVFFPASMLFSHRRSDGASSTGRLRIDVGVQHRQQGLALERRAAASPPPHNKSPEWWSRGAPRSDLDHVWIATQTAAGTYFYNQDTGETTDFGAANPNPTPPPKLTRQQYLQRKDPHLRSPGGERVTTSSTAVCIVGQARSLVLPAVYRSIKKNVLDTFGTDTQTAAVLFLNSDAPHLDQRRSEQLLSRTAKLDKSEWELGGSKLNHGQCAGNLSTALDHLGLQQVEVYDTSNCHTYAKATGTELQDCKHSTAWLQVEWIRHCFSLLQQPADVYVRVRPDSFFARPIPALSSLGLTGRKPAIVSWPAAGSFSDQFFMFNSLMYQLWWKTWVVTGEVTSIWNR